jgi:hypothetical protein
VDAFAPVVLKPREDGPFQLGPLLRRLAVPADAKRALEQALVDEIAAWSYTDGIERGVFLLKFAGWFGCLGLEAALSTLLGRPNHAGRKGRLALASALAFVICKRMDADAALALGRRMSDAGMASMSVMVQIIAHAAKSTPEQVPALLDEFLPDWDSNGLTTADAHLLADQLVDRLGLSTIARLVLYDTARQFATVNALLRANRLEFDFTGDTIYVTDKVSGQRIQLSREHASPQAQHATKDHAFSLFSRGGLGDLGVPDTDLEAIQTAGNA